MNQCIGKENHGQLQNNKITKTSWENGGPVCENFSQGFGLFSRPQTSRSINFLRFHNFIGFISWFLRKLGLVCENWSQGSGLMAGHVFWAQEAQMYFLGPRAQGQNIFWDFIMLQDVSYNSWENVILFLKTEPKVLI